MVVGCAFTRVGDKVSKRASDTPSFACWFFCRDFFGIRPLCVLLLFLSVVEVYSKSLLLKCDSPLRHLALLYFRHSSSPGRGRYSTSLHRSPVVIEW